jgi:spermidine synthase
MARVFLVAVALALSGAAALVYEVTWTRQLGLLMGHTVASASTVLAAFMLGLGLGAAIAGRVAERLTPVGALRAYGGVEICIGVLACLLPLELAGLRPLLSWAYGESGGTSFGLIRLLSAIVVVSVPAVGMGATLPLVVRWWVPSPNGAALRVAWLYAANTAGATTGALVSGFVLLPELGTRATTLLAVAMNIGSAALALWVSRRPAVSSARPASEHGGGSVDVFRYGMLVASVALALSGAASLVLQLTWTRLLSLVLGPTTYAFSLMVSTFIGGIAIGSAAGGWTGKRGPSPRILAGWLCLAGVAAVVASAWAHRIPSIIAGAAAAESSLGSLISMQAVLVAMVMLPMTVALGAAFPLSIGLALAGSGRVAERVAWLYVANTAGAICGALAGGFVLIPAWGLQRSTYIAASLCLVAAALVWMSQAARRKWISAVVAAAAGAAIWLLPPWDRALLSSGAYKYAAYMPAEYRDAMLRAGDLLYYREGAASTISVRRAAGAVTLAIDGKVDASNAGDMLTQRLLAHVPLLLHPDPRNVAVIGLGSGVTVGSVLRHPVTRVDAIEISPQVIEAAAYFTGENGSALADRRVRVVLGDGRTHLALGPQQYDVIVSEPSNPWIAGIAGLFTREMFEIARSRLAGGGVLCQWAHVYDMSDDDLRSIAGTFLAVFPHALLWAVGDHDVLLIGSNEPLVSRLPLMRDHWRRHGVASDLAGVAATSPEIVHSLLAADTDELRSFATGSAVQTDDRMALEFSGPRSAFGVSGRTGLTALRALVRSSASSLARRTGRSALALRDRGLMLFRAESFEPAAADLLEAVRMNPDDEQAIDGLLRAAGPAGRLDEVDRLLREVLGANPSRAQPAIGVSRVLASRGDFKAASEILRPVLEAGEAEAPLEQLASVYADAGDPRLSRAVIGLRKVAPGSRATAYFSAVLALAEGRPHEAIDRMRWLVDRGAAGARELTLLGSAYGALRRHADARQAFLDAIRAGPRQAAGYENLGTAALAAEDTRAAAGYFAEALILDASSVVARQGLADALGRR